jgi:5'-AMP-activated protein kinase regulatory gamma subunit
MDFLKTLKVPSPVFPNDSNKLVTINSESSIAEAFKTLISQNILSVPLYDERTRTYINSLSIVDVILHALDSHSCDSLDSDVTSALSLLSDKEHFRSCKAKDVARKSSQPPVLTNPDVTIDKVVGIMEKTKAQHVLAVNNKGELTNVITQSRIVECINMLFGVDPGLTTLGEKTVLELGMGLREVVSINENAKASDAFRMLADENITGMAVLDYTGTLTGNISVRDLRAIKHNAAFLKLLSHPVAEYLEVAHNEYGVPKTVITCSLQDSYKYVMGRIVDNKVHRCYVVSETNTLVGVVTMWDLLHQLIQFPSIVHAP